VYCLPPREGRFYQACTEEYVLREGEFSFPWGTLHVQYSELPAGAGKNFFQEQVLRGIFWLDAVSLRERVILRAARLGERVRLACDLSKKVSDILAEVGVPLPLRRTALVLAFEGGPAVALFVPAMLMYGRVGSALYVREGRPAFRLRFVLSGGACLE
jgi:tRNA(Ile)-lysidine synthetase-like protein